MKKIRTNLGNNPASPDNFYEEEGVYENYVAAITNKNEIDEIDEEMSLSIREDIMNDDVIESIIESKEPENEDPYASILKDVH